ncbi:hypothetical protein Bca4012_047351 [Brassica carinata]
MIEAQSSISPSPKPETKTFTVVNYARQLETLHGIFFTSQRGHLRVVEMMWYHVQKVTQKLSFASSDHSSLCPQPPLQERLQGLIEGAMRKLHDFVGEEERKKKTEPRGTVNGGRPSSR